MGVHDLWSIVEPVRESVPLYSLSGKTLAVDLSLWVCEAQHVQAMMGRVTKPHLRNLFFRVSSLTLMGVKLVFVMEGEAPKLKAETMSKRTETRFGGFKKPAATKCTTNTSRGRFKAVLRECADMLDYLGVPWMTAAGEAEAMCAFLDSQGLVEGCITNDGDAFLYGARTVYRNFNMNSKDPQVDCYRTSRVKTELRLCRENLVGLAILLGCDYIPKGIPGVGKEQALKLIQTLKGHTVLQRFNQWKEDEAGVSECVVKKVPHCHICRHPGSAKAHERGGCVLCDSKHFCQPQDFDYKCPCDWHCHEQTRQSLSFEANIKKKTLASQQFPFTEIISEFLIAKDKPVSHFKWRQPNMLLMQKFAYEKMEWPKHYTSEKVLVLMTYTELMNRKYGREMSSQINPLRIVKPRVRNGVACFEVIWSTPGNYVFADDQPAENQQEVRTIEEESLFCVAFPEVVERYMRDKTLAEQNKTKKKITKSKKEKPLDVSDGVSDGISDLLAQMTLQKFSSTNSTQPPTLLPDNLNTEKTDVIILDTALNHKQHKRENEKHNVLSDWPRTPVSNSESDAVASPSVSAVIDVLHLSDIDWDASSFTSSPPPQMATNHTPDIDGKETDCDNTKQKTSSDNTQTDSRSALELSYTECSLKDRVLMRNTAKAIHQRKVDDVVSKHVNYELASLEDIASPDSKPNGQITTKSSHDSKMTGNEAAVYKKQPLPYKSQFVANKVVMETKTSKQLLLSALKDQCKAKNKCTDLQKLPQKYKHFQTAISSSAVPPERCHSDPGQSDKDQNMSQKKRSVCMSVCSSSEDSDTENQQFGPQRQAKLNPINKIKGSFIADSPLKPLLGPKIAKPTMKQTLCLQPLGPNSQRQSVDVDVNSTHTSTKSKYQEVSPSKVDSQAFLQSPESPIVELNSDDSVICSESPLPLAERLRLKFLT
ncbi:Flap endonuclease GEN -like protein 1 [Channa argus]|uniref:Flap endonuclease GEN homolog 1 n=1 Tax=Channa argus TaxID=215402 RepID=A0A6G1QJM1_CHAAH|nr:Flap endonuclease GEN -like protein 1 [Channa argus]KAK2890122.1 hypothetical protein Q8A73_018422 [Channa argus]